MSFRPTRRILRLLTGVGLMAIWVTGDWGSQLADSMIPDAPTLPRPDVSGRMHVDVRARIQADAVARQAEVIAATAAREQVLAGVLGALFTAGCLVIILGGRWTSRRRSSRSVRE